VLQRIAHALKQSRRGIIGMALAVAFAASIAAPALADTTTGNISGTVTTSTGQPVPNVNVVAAAPSARYTAKTDAKGFYSIVGVIPDTYSITFSGSGYQGATINGVTVNPTITSTVNQTLTTQLKTIGSTTSRASGVSAFQPQQAEDTYSVNANQINTILGKSHATSETQLIISLPGASLDRSGYPVLRGGRENDEGFQFEGIDYTDAFTHQFVNTLSLNGVSNFQLSPGAGDASVGNVGTGQINASVKRGAHPSFGNAELDVRGPTYYHQASTEFGWATPTGNLSSYTSFVGSDNNNQCGRTGQDCNLVGQQLFNDYVKGRDFIENAVYKFGANKNQSLQAFYQNQIFNFYNNVMFANQHTLPYEMGSPDWLFFSANTLGITPAEWAGITPFEYGQHSLNQPLGRPAATSNQPNETIKLQYSNTLNQSTFMTIKAYKVNSSTIFDYPYLALCSGVGLNCDSYAIQGGQRTGFAADFTKQVGQKHLLGFGGKYELVHPIDTFQSGSLGALAAVFTPENTYDFLPASSPSCTGVLSAAFGFNPCGYLPTAVGAPGTPIRIPDYNQSPSANRHDTGFYLQDQFQATDRLKITAGARVDNASFDYPSNPLVAGFNDPGGVGYSSGLFLPIKTGVYTSGPLATACGGGPCPDPAKDVYGDTHRTSSTLQPRFSFAYQFNPRNSVTFSYGRSVVLPPIAFVDDRIPRAQYAGFAGIPANLAVCGPTGDRTCRDYADQLYWLNQNTLGGVPIAPAKPSTLNNYDASLQHDFGNGLSAKLTPFYRRGYDVLAQFAFPLVVNGQPVFDQNGNAINGPTTTSNLGTSYTTGVEFYMTKTATYGLSGTLSLTYINEFTNVIPLSGNEDFFPAIPPASLFQGNIYRVGFISPFNGVAALQYKWRSGWRVNPIIGFNIGYPIGTGLITAYGLNGKYYNLPATNVTNGSTSANQYVDPANPGTVFHPNVAASRGTPEKNSAGGVLSAPRINIANLDVEYNKPGSRSTVGLLVSNLFNQIYSEPSFNGRYQPVATGISGPKSGTTSGQVLFPGQGYRNYASYRFNNQPYILSPSGTPTEFRLYYQLSL